MLALLAFLGNVMYLKNVHDDAYGDAKLVKVFVVAKAIPKGTTGEQAISQSYVRSGEIPQEFRPGSAIADINDIRGKVAVNALSPGQPVVDGQFVDPNVAQVTFAQRIPAGQVAVTVSVDQVHGVAGLLVPGDKVDMLVSWKDVENEQLTGNSVLYQNVNILAIGAKAAPQAGDTTAAKSTAQQVADSGLITFAVPLEAAQRIALVANGDFGNGLYLALVPPDNTPVSPAPAPVTNFDIFDNLPVTPYPNENTNG